MATPTTKGSSWLKASIAAPVSFRKQRLILAASSDDNGGERRVFEKPFRGVFIITPIAHLSVTAGFRRAAVSISSFIVRKLVCNTGFKACWLSFEVVREELRNPPERFFIDRP